MKNNKKQNKRQNRFALSEADDGALSLVAGKTGLLINRESSRDFREKYFDTFDWRLFNGGHLLVQTGSRLELKEIETGDVIEMTEATIPASRHWHPKKILDGRLKKMLGETTGLRAVIEVCSLRRKRAAYNLRGKDGRTALRAHIDEARLSEADAIPLPPVLSLVMIEGHDKEFDEVSRGLSEAGLTAARPESFFLKAALARIGRLPDDYSPKYGIRLPRTTQARKALVAVLRHLADIMQRNVEGIINDIDTEFLHDFRVAIRRSRSALGQVKGTLPEAPVRHFREEFAKVGKLTNELRDLDVQLINMPAHVEQTPPCLRKGLDEYFNLLERKRECEHDRLSKELRSPGFRKLMARWIKFLDEAERRGPTENSDAPVGAIAASLIHKRFKKVVKKARLTTDDSDGAKLHVLRIDCKKLRYLLEIFSTCFTRQSFIPIVERLRGLQDILGDLNDHRVLQDALVSHLEHDAPRPLMAAALGALISRSHEHRLELMGGLRGGSGQVRRQRRGGA